MFEPFASRSQADLSAVAGSVGDFTVVAWLHPVDGRLSIVELDVRQAGPGAAEDALAYISEQIDERSKRYSSSPPAALPRAFLSEIQFREILSAHKFVQESVVSQRSPRSITIVEPGQWTASIAVDELRMLEPLVDAVTYVNALAAGLSNPASAIAEARGIDPRSAQNRVGVARNKFGLLTKPPMKGQPGGELTEKARNLLERMEKLSAAFESKEPSRG